MGILKTYPEGYEGSLRKLNIRKNADITQREDRHTLAIEMSSTMPAPQWGRF